jgi:acetoin utilization deacetylase AcuC-like enzyme
VSVALFTHKACLEHNPGADHPESPSRLATVLEALDIDRFAWLDRIEAPRATRAQLERVHRVDLIDSIFCGAGTTGERQLDEDTFMSSGSLEAALRAAGACCAAVDAVLDGKVRRAFCAVRPPGHHATPSAAMGFCLFNNVAVAAAHAVDARGLERVAVIDFDVHHGNGTQDIFWADPGVLYVSTHQSPLYPDTGLDTERGQHQNILNIPLAAGAGATEFRAAFESILLPAINAFAPQLVLVSAGFDAHRLDPLADLNLEAADFAWITEQLVAIAERHAEGRLVSSLEGGYHLSALRESTLAHVAALADPWAYI